MLVMGLLGLGLVADAKKPEADAEDDATCGISVVFGTRARVYATRFRRCREHHAELDKRVKRVPWDLVISDEVRRVGMDSTAEWRVDLRVTVLLDAPVSAPPTHVATGEIDATARALSDRFTAPAADRHLRLERAVLYPPEDGMDLLLAVAGVALTPETPDAYVVEDNGIVLYNRRALERGRVGLASSCDPWVVFDTSGTPTDLMTHPPRACARLNGAFLEPLLWTWTPPRWDGQAVPVGVPLQHTGVGGFQVGSKERFAPFYAGDTLVTDVPYPLDVQKGRRPRLQRAPEMEIPMILPELLESRLGIQDASTITCSVHVWAAPARSTPYALSVRDCPDFFASVVATSYEGAALSTPSQPTEYVERVVFAFDDDAETWRISRR